MESTPSAVALARAAGSTHAPLVRAAARAQSPGVRLGTAVLVEGLSDRAALQTLSRRRGRDLAADGVLVVSIGGATSISLFLDLFGPHGLDLRLAGLCDLAEEREYRHRLERAGLGCHLTRDGMEALGFYVCDVDLEDELIRSLGVTAVEEVLESQGELRLFRSFQNQPAQRDRPNEAQLRRFMGTRSGRKIRYARELVVALDLSRVPPPLDRLLAHV